MPGRGRRPTKVTVETEEVAPKKVGRKKQFAVIATITPDGIEGNLLPEVKKPLIVHLPIQSRDITLNDMPIMYDPHPPGVPEPYDSFSGNPFMNEAERLVESVEQIANVPKVDKVDDKTNAVNMDNIDFYNLKGTLLVQFKDSSEMKKIPEKSDVACFWCCHQFSNRPVVLPVKDQGDYLQVCGNFCCPECAAAYLFDMRQDSHTRWEQLALLYRVYGEACNGKIQPAPNRNILSLFGGNLSIQEYRSLLRSQKVRIDVHLPPMVSLLSTMDTKPIDFYDDSLIKNVNETVKERLQKAEEVLRLRRTKPLKAWESTLDACINLKIRHDDIPCS